jgi:hypothetical protein
MEHLFLRATIGGARAIVSRAAIVALAAAASPLAWAEDLGPKAPKPVFGAYDIVTHVFTPATPATATVIEADARAAAIIRKGTLVVEVSTSLAAIPNGQQVLAFVSANLSDARYQNGVGTSGALKRSGDTAKASFSMPYLFTALNASETVTVSIQLATQKVPYPTTILTKEIPLPANGAKTVVTFPAAL